MTDLIKALYYLVEDGLPLRPGDPRKADMEAVLYKVMGQAFMEEYAMACFDEDWPSRMDLFRHSLALGVSLAGLRE